MKKTYSILMTLLLMFGINSAVHAITITYDFTGECDDCVGTLGDGDTQTVWAMLSLIDVDVDNGMIDFRGAGEVIFSYGGSNLLNTFTMSDPYLFTPGLMTDGTVASGSVFEIGSSVNTTDPGNPRNFDFDPFCTAQGIDVLGRGDCSNVGLVSFLLDSDGNWSITGEIAFDIGFNGQLSPSVIPVPAAVWLFVSGLLGLVGVARRK